jgi:RimJ/RimL family protein N-acetyltransferase
MKGDVPVLYFRKLRSFDAADFQTHLLKLDDADRRARFSGNVADEVVIAYAASVDWTAACLLGCFDGKQLCAVAELHADFNLPARGGEFAVTVAPAYRNRGIGSELLRRTILMARNRMIGKLHMICLIDNQPMRRMADKFHGQLDFEDGQVWAKLAIPYPDPMSLFSEAYAEGMGLAAAMGAAR